MEEIEFVVADKYGNDPNPVYVGVSQYLIAQGRRRGKVFRQDLLDGVEMATDENDNSLSHDEYEELQRQVFAAMGELIKEGRFFRKGKYYQFNPRTDRK